MGISIFSPLKTSRNLNIYNSFSKIHHSPCAPNSNSALATQGSAAMANARLKQARRRASSRSSNAAQPVVLPPAQTLTASSLAQKTPSPQDEQISDAQSEQAALQAALLERESVLEDKIQALTLGKTMHKELEPGCDPSGRRVARYHRDYLLQEMEWMAADFSQERKWRLRNAKMLSQTLVSHLDRQEQRLARQKKSEEIARRRTAARVGRDIKKFWTKIDKIIAFKSESSDADFEMLEEEEDDETTIEAEERRSGPISRRQAAAEIATLQEEGEMSIEELRARYAAVEESNELTRLVKEENELSIEELRARYAEALEADETPATLQDDAMEVENDADVADEEFVPTRREEEDQADDEATIEEEERLEGVASPSQKAEELRLLQEEGEMSIEQLRARYAAASNDGETSNPENEGSESDEGHDAVDREQERPEADEPMPEEVDALASDAITTPARKSGYKRPYLLTSRLDLREYQEAGVNWLISMCERRINGILADEMGLGKTIQTISLLAHLACAQGLWGPHLIVVPTSCLVNWEMEFKRWCPAFKVLTYFGSAKRVRAAPSSQRRLLLTGTPLQNNLLELWALMHFLMPHVFSSRKEFSYWFQNPLALMVENWSDPAQSGDNGVEGGKDLVTQLHGIIRPFVLRRLKKDVAKQLPGKFEHVITCQLSKRQRFLYEDFISRSTRRREYWEQKRQVLPSFKRFKLDCILTNLCLEIHFSGLARCRPSSHQQWRFTSIALELFSTTVSRHKLYKLWLKELEVKHAQPVANRILAPYHNSFKRTQLFFPDKALVQFDCGKLQQLAVLLRTLKRGGHRCLIFTQMSSMLNILEVFLNLHGHTYFRTGEEPEDVESESELEDEETDEDMDNEVSLDTVENAMAQLEDEEDVVAMKGARAEYLQELNEFDDDAARDLTLVTRLQSRRHHQDDTVVNGRGRRGSRRDLATPDGLEQESMDEDDDHKKTAKSVGNDSVAAQMLEEKRPNVRSFESHDQHGKNGDKVREKARDAAEEQKLQAWKASVQSLQGFEDSLNPVDRYALHFREDVDPFSEQIAERYTELYRRARAHVLFESRKRLLTGAAWSLMKCANTGQPFYFNADTREATWECPPVWLANEQLKSAQKRGYEGLPPPALRRVLSMLTPFPERHLCADGEDTPWSKKAARATQQNKKLANWQHLLSVVGTDNCVWSTASLTVMVWVTLLGSDFEAWYTTRWTFNDLDPGCHTTSLCWCSNANSCHQDGCYTCCFSSNLTTGTSAVVATSATTLRGTTPLAAAVNTTQRVVPSTPKAVLAATPTSAGAAVAKPASATPVPSTAPSTMPTATRAGLLQTARAVAVTPTIPAADTLLVLQNCRIRGAGSSGVLLVRGSLVMSLNTVEGNAHSGVTVLGGQALMRRNKIQRNARFGLRLLYHAGNVSWKDNVVLGNACGNLDVDNSGRRFVVRLNDMDKRKKTSEKLPHSHGKLRLKTYRVLEKEVPRATPIAKPVTNVTSATMRNYPRQQANLQRTYDYDYRSYAKWNVSIRAQVSAKRRPKTQQIVVGGREIVLRDTCEKPTEKVVKPRRPKDPQTQCLRLHDAADDVAFCTPVEIRPDTGSDRRFCCPGWKFWSDQTSGSYGECRWSETGSTNTSSDYDAANAAWKRSVSEYTGYCGDTSSSNCFATTVAASSPAVSASPTEPVNKSAKPGEKRKLEAAGAETTTD
ncbi:P-loop containing nucleoside triphosphate hydrolase [Phytophthora cactorum]|nr:P-loop containing nucleoside triphosphate hydrolase [Phytophthora cactorum]